MTEPKNKKVLVVEDGPTLTHGEMSYGAGVIAAQRYGAASLVDPRPLLTGTLQETFKKYPAMLCGALRICLPLGRWLWRPCRLRSCDCDLVLSATPIDLTRLISINKPLMRIHYEYQDHGDPTLEKIIHSRLGEDDELSILK